MPSSACYLPSQSRAGCNFAGRLTDAWRKSRRQRLPLRERPLTERHRPGRVAGRLRRCSTQWLRSRSRQRSQRWSFILEPYLWALGVDGTVGVKRFDTHVDYNPLTVVKHLDWGIMAKGEVRKGKWGILGDGFFAQLSASGDPPGPLYNNANIKLQQGMVELALAYRIIDDRRGFLDIYAGARYNYFGIDVDASIDDAGVQEM